LKSPFYNDHRGLPTVKEGGGVGLLSEVTVRSFPAAIRTWLTSEWDRPDSNHGKLEASEVILLFIRQ
jgi:hypothetical protein